MITRSTFIGGLALLAASAGSAFSQSGEIKLGFNGDISASPSAQSGQASVLGLQAAMEDINAKGGVLGKKLTLIVRDDLSQPPKSIQNMSDLIDNEKVAAVFGPTNSGNALAWRHIPNQKKVPVMGTIGSATDITKPMAPNTDNYMFRVSMVDRSQVAGLMAYLKKTGTTKVGYLAETTGYGQGGLKDVQEIGDLQGIKPLGTDKFGVADTDMTSQLGKFKAAGIDTVVVWAQGTPIGQLMRSMEKIDYKPLVLTSWAADNQSYYDAAGAALADRPIFMRTISEERTPAQQKLFDRLSPQMASKSAFGFAAHSYDAMMILAMAIQQAGSTDGPAIRAALEDLKAPYDGLMKRYEKPFTKDNHDALGSGDYRWNRWKDGKLVPYSDAITKAMTPADYKQ